MTKLGAQIKKISHIDSERFRVNLLFSDGYKGTIDLTDIFENPKGLAAEVLRGNFFSRCFVEDGALAWPNGLEFCPDMLRMNLETKHKNLKNAA